MQGATNFSIVSINGRRVNQRYQRFEDGQWTNEIHDGGLQFEDFQGSDESEEVQTIEISKGNVIPPALFGYEDINRVIAFKPFEACSHAPVSPGPVPVEKIPVVLSASSGAIDIDIVSERS